MTEQADLDIETRTTQYVIDTVLDTLQDEDLSQEDKEGIIILHLEELLKRGRIYEIMRERLAEISAYYLDGEEINDPEFRCVAIETDQIDGNLYNPSFDAICNELQGIVENARETLKAVSKIEKGVASAMIPCG